MTKLLLLPDFVGHPICFHRIITGVSEDVEFRIVNYHDLWPYDSVGALAKSVHQISGSWGADGLIGYSFGGLVAFELALQIAKQPRVMLIDSHLSPVFSEPIDRCAAGPLDAVVPADLVTAIAELSDIGEIKVECVRGNLAHFISYSPSGRLARIKYLRCADQIWGDPLAQWRAHCDELDVTHSTAAHHAVMSDQKTKEFVLNLRRDNANHSLLGRSSI